VREARLAEIRNELLQSKKLDSFFATNPREMNALRHDKQTKAIKRQAHLVDVPQYIGIYVVCMMKIIIVCTFCSSCTTKRQRLFNTCTSFTQICWHVKSECKEDIWTEATGD
jgi:hypothetical protein